MASNFLKRKKLSKHVLDMKFMKRTKESEDLKRFEDEGRAFFSDANPHIKSEDDKASNIIVQHSWYLAENLMLGRYSFSGANPKIEQIMKSYCDFIKDEDEVMDETDVDVTARQLSRGIKRNKKKERNVHEYLDLEEEARNTSLIKTIASKFNKGKRKQSDFQDDVSTPQQKKRFKFIKPESDD